MSYVERMLGALVFIAVLTTVVRWILSKAKRSPPLYVAHIIAYVSAVLLYAVLAADGPLVGGRLDIASPAAMYALPQLLWFVVDQVRGRRRADVGPVPQETES